MFFAVFTVLLVVALAVLLGCCKAIGFYDDIDKLVKKKRRKKE